MHQDRMGRRLPRRRTTAPRTASGLPREARARGDARRVIAAFRLDADGAPIGMPTIASSTSPENALPSSLQSVLFCDKFRTILILLVEREATDLRQPSQTTCCCAQRVSAIRAQATAMKFAQQPSGAAHVGSPARASDAPAREPELEKKHETKRIMNTKVFIGETLPSLFNFRVVSLLVLLLNFVLPSTCGDGRSKDGQRGVDAGRRAGDGDSLSPARRPASTPRSRLWSVVRDVGIFRGAAYSLASRTIPQKPPTQRWTLFRPRVGSGGAPGGGGGHTGDGPAGAVSRRIRHLRPISPGTAPCESEAMSVVKAASKQVK